MKLEWYRESHMPNVHHQQNRHCSRWVWGNFPINFNKRKVFGGYFVTVEGEIRAFVSGLKNVDRKFKSVKKARKWVESRTAR